MKGVHRGYESCAKTTSLQVDLTFEFLNPHIFNIQDPRQLLLLLQHQAISLELV